MTPPAIYSIHLSEELVLACPQVDEEVPAPPSPPPAARARGVLASHRLFTVVLAVAAGLRVTTILGYRPGRIYYVDS